MTLWIVKMKFDGPVHFGEVGIGLEAISERVSSDTLFSALLNAWVVVYGRADAESLLDRFLENDPPFRLSSAFLFRGKEYYLPRPLISVEPAADAQGGAGFGKSLKKTRFLPVETFQKIQRGEPIAADKLDPIRMSYTNSFRQTIVPRVALDRVTSRSTIYHCGLTWFTEDAGLYALIELCDEGLQSRLIGALRALGDIGLGGERTYGYGRFESTWYKATDSREGEPSWSALFEDRDTASGYLTLSVVSPTENELDGIEENVQAYALEERRGWIFSPEVKQQLKRKTVIMFAEGSVFKRPLSGRLVEVTPKAWEESKHHAVYRYGFAFNIPLYNRGGG